MRGQPWVNRSDVCPAIRQATLEILVSKEAMTMGLNKETVSQRRDMFLRQFIDIDSNTFGNGLKSYQAVYPASDSVAAENANRIINSPEFAAIVAGAIVSAGWDMGITICRLFDVAMGRRKRTATIVHADGTSTEISYKPTFADRLFAHDMLFRLKGGIR